MCRLSIQALHHRLDDRSLLSNIGFELRSGEIVTLVGPSGCGKSTLLRLIVGFEKLQTGEIRVGDDLLASSIARLHTPPEKRRIGFVCQDNALFPHFDAGSNMRYGVRDNWRRVSEWIGHTADHMGLGGVSSRMPRSLSGGQQKRVALIRAMAAASRIMLLDEPFNGLDPGLRQQVIEDVIKALRSAGKPTIVVSHDADEARGYSDRIIVLNGGGIAQDDSPERLVNAPADEYVASLFGPVNRFEGEAIDGRINTPLGVVDAPRELAGRVIVILKPAGLRVLPVDQRADAPRHGVAASVESCHLLGNGADLRVRTLQDKTLMRAWMKDGVYIKPGNLIRIDADPRQLFVFPKRR